MAGQGSTGNVIAALASFFIPGLGQLLQGRLFAAAFWFLTVVALYTIAPVTLGLSWIFGAFLHLVCILNAAMFRASK